MHIHQKTRAFLHEVVAAEDENEAGMKDVTNTHLEYMQK